VDFGVTGKARSTLIQEWTRTIRPCPVLLQGYDFTRNQPGAFRMGRVAELENGPVDQSSQDQQPGVVQQSTAAVLDQSTAAVLDGGPYVAFGHGTMTADSSTWSLRGRRFCRSKRSLRTALPIFRTSLRRSITPAHGANVINMSFDLSVPSAALSNAISKVNQSGVILVAAAGNENTSARVYPAALNETS